MAFLFCVSLLGAASAKGANVLIILADDLGYGDVSAYRPNADIRTPNMDSFAAQGMRFTHMRANCCVCSPSRAALLSGCYADRVGVPGLIRGDPASSWGFFDPSVPTLGNVLHTAGYDTAIVGKWNLGLVAPNLPNQRGFDFYHGFLEDMMDSYTTHLRNGKNFMRRNTDVVDPVGHATDIFTDWACEYLEDATRKQRPFFLYLAYNAPHYPIEPPREWIERVRAREPNLPEKRLLNVALVEHLDAGIGRVLETLKRTGLDQETLVFLTSDNGGLLRVGANNDPWRGGKGDYYEGGLCVPFIARWPGHISPGSVSDYRGLVFDIFPTAAEAAAVHAPAGIDAVSLMPAFRGETPTRRELYFVRREGEQFGGKSYEALVRDGWKLMQNNPYAPLELYNLSDDPDEKRDVIGEHPDLKRELQAALASHIRIGGATPWEPLPHDSASP